MQRRARGERTYLCGTQRAYVRDYLNGSTVNLANHWGELEVWGTRITVTVGPHFEKNLTTHVVTQYYYLGGPRIAVRQGLTLTYLHGDHLGSASLATRVTGTLVRQRRYLPSPWGRLKIAAFCGIMAIPTSKEVIK